MNPTIRIALTILTAIALPSLHAMQRPKSVPEFQTYLKDFKQAYETAVSNVQQFNADQKDAAILRERLMASRKSLDETHTILTNIYAGYAAFSGNAAIRQNINKVGITINDQHTCINDAFFSSFRKGLSDLGITLTEKELQMLTNTLKDKESKDKTTDKAPASAHKRQKEDDAVVNQAEQSAYIDKIQDELDECKLNLSKAAGDYMAAQVQIERLQNQVIAQDNAIARLNDCNDSLQAQIKKLSQQISDLLK